MDKVSPNYTQNCTQCGTVLSSEERHFLGNICSKCELANFRELDTGANAPEEPYSMLQYQRDAQRTKSEQFHVPKAADGPHIHEIMIQLPHCPTHDLIHAIIGIATEAGEFLDPIKKLIFYGKPLDLVNLDEEAGDLLWYLAIYAEARGTTIPELARRNIEKLRVRYPDKFTSSHALERDLLAERKSLEGGPDTPGNEA